mmetsp:Transcript_41766/g.75185  ORF Transcript_41766/g.75185 Transcript_41766/m.75185 type:complete len:206 (+) Transcript_41766:432-1049(+)
MFLFPTRSMNMQRGPRGCGQKEKKWFLFRSTFTTVLTHWPLRLRLSPHVTKELRCLPLRLFTRPLFTNGLCRLSLRLLTRPLFTRGLYRLPHRHFTRPFAHRNPFLLPSHLLRNRRRFNLPPLERLRQLLPSTQVNTLLHEQIRMIHREKFLRLFIENSKILLFQWWRFDIVKVKGTHQSGLGIHQIQTIRPRRVFVKIGVIFRH